MTTFFIDFELKSTDSYKIISRIPYPEIEEKKLLAKKRIRDEEYFQIYMESEFYKSKAEEVSEAFSRFFQCFQKRIY